MHSALLRVRSAPPEIEAVPVQEFTAPGLFRYQIRAKDSDENELTYKLLSPLDAGILLNSKTGLLQWPISPEALSRYGQRLEIQFEVDDPDGNRVSGTLTLNLTEKR